MRPAELARRIGASRQHVQRWMSGEVRISPEWAAKIAQELGTSAAALLGLSLVEPTPPDAGDPTIVRAIGARIRWARLYRSLDLAEAARRFAMPEDRLDSIERGDAEPRVAEIATISAKLRLSADFLIRGAVESLPYQTAEDYLRETRPGGSPPPLAIYDMGQ